MIGIGTWEAEINTVIIKGNGRVIISDIDGKYDFQIDIDGMSMPDVKFFDIVEDGNTLSATATCDFFRGRKIPVTVTFDGDTAVCETKIPMMGKLRLNAKKTA